jgi:1-acylglycerone phosphate reductase
VLEIPAIEADPQAVKAMFEANVFGLFNMVSAFTPLLLASVSGSKLPPTIINTSSIVSRAPFPLAAQYNATKAAVSSYSDTLRLELAPLGIKVVTVFMGVVSTRITDPEKIKLGPDSLYKDLENGLKERSRNHLRDGMKPEEFAKQVASEVLRSSALGKSEHLWKGGSATLVWALNAFGPRKVFDSSLLSAVGLTGQVKRLIFERGQQSANSASQVK